MVPSVTANWSSTSMNLHIQHDVCFNHVLHIKIRGQPFFIGDNIINVISS
ncbi:hypothetical protein Scep_026030 [Stephania cephalantha]|uniref:Uncharacterized protein n=1 Tax=Stephania cephalantha TaxID=152367 RepID=A0AAP0HS41_9MAGN